MISAYLAAPYSWKEQIRAHAAQLSDEGWRVTARWVHEADPGSISFAARDAAQLEEYAIRDLSDIDDAELFVFFSLDPEVATPRGGRHVELGYALARGKRIIVVGPRENIFHHLPQVECVGSWREFLDRYLHSVPA